MEGILYKVALITVSFFSCQRNHDLEKAFSACELLGRAVCPEFLMMWNMFLVSRYFVLDSTSSATEPELKYYENKAAYTVFHPLYHSVGLSSGLGQKAPKRVCVPACQRSRGHIYALPLSLFVSIIDVCAWTCMCVCERVLCMCVCLSVCCVCVCVCVCMCLCVCGGGGGGGVFFFF